MKARGVILLDELYAFRSKYTSDLHPEIRYREILGGGSFDPCLKLPSTRPIILKHMSVFGAAPAMQKLFDNALNLVLLKKFVQ